MGAANFAGGGLVGGGADVVIGSVLGLGSGGRMRGLRFHDAGQLSLGTNLRIEYIVLRCGTYPR